MENKRPARYMLSARGSMLTEGTVMMPFFIIAVITLLYLLKACLLDIEVVTMAENELRRASCGESLSISAASHNALKEIGEDESGLQVYSVPEILVLDEFDGTEQVHFNYETKIRLPVLIKNSIKLENSFVYREWKGKQEYGHPFGFSAMLNDQDGCIVYIFPRAGGRYHDAGCRYVNSYAIKEMLDNAIRKKYKPCPLCCNGSEVNGQEIYIFRYGASFHRKNCDSVEKYVIETEREDALLKGYTACSVCGG